MGIIKPKITIDILNPSLSSKGPANIGRMQLGSGGIRINKLY